MKTVFADAQFRMLFVSLIVTAVACENRRCQEHHHYVLLHPHGLLVIVIAIGRVKN